MRLFLGITFLAVLGAVFFLVLVPNKVEFLPGQNQGSRVGSPADAKALAGKQGSVGVLPPVPEPAKPTSTSAVRSKQPTSLADIEKQLPLPNPPEVIKGIYVTAWVAGSPTRISRLIDLIKRTELNAVVIDIKDFSGYVSYRTGISEVAASGAEGELRILQPNALIKRLHDEGIYVIARQTVFQDPILAKAHPEWALQNASTSGTWLDHKGLAWMDAAAKPVWDYNIAIAKDAISRGFDEVNFDYIRFASDGDLTKIAYPFWDQKSYKATVIKNFFRYLRENLTGARISADLFGLSTVNHDDLGIGQTIESAYEYFDYVSPMVYPSHYAKTFLGFQNPAEHPYEVVKYSMEQALQRLTTHDQKLTTNSSSTASSSVISHESSVRSAKLRPWLQDFDLGATYGADKVRGQIQAIYDAFSGASATSSSPEPIWSSYYNGWMLWNPANTYTEGALNLATSN